MPKLSIGLAFLLLVTGAQAATDGAIDKPLIAQTLDGFNRESSEIRAGMQPDGRYQFLKASDKSRVEARMASMQALLQAPAGADVLSMPDKISVANDQEEVNAILRHNEPTAWSVRVARQSARTCP
jgi:hypothetical protein